MLVVSGVLVAVADAAVVLVAVADAAVVLVVDVGAAVGTVRAARSVAERGLGAVADF